jgi:hypothetical protein
MLYEASFLNIKNYNHGENVNTTTYGNLMNSFWTAWILRA